MARKKLLCLDAGHFHPTEVISDKISSVLTFLEEILLSLLEKDREKRPENAAVLAAILGDGLVAVAEITAPAHALGPGHRLDLLLDRGDLLLDGFGLRHGRRGGLGGFLLCLLVLAFELVEALGEHLDLVAQRLHFLFADLGAGRGAAQEHAQPEKEGYLSHHVISVVWSGWLPSGKSMSDL